MKHCYLFSYHVEPARDGLHLAYSHDGRNWAVLRGNNSFLSPEIGAEKLMRDPHVFLGPDGIFRLVWTCGWAGTGIGYAWSRDLAEWSAQRYLPVMEHESTTINTWAPEIIFDPQTRHYLIFWSSTIPGLNPATDNQSNQGPPAPGKNNRIFYTKTADFETFAPTRLFYDPGFNCIDACIAPDGKRFLMFLKDETNKPFVPQKCVKLAVADSAEGPYGPASERITGQYWCEGPSAIKIGDTWFVYFDKFRDKQYGAVISKDLVHWEDVSDRLNMPKGVKHGTVFKVPSEILDRLLKL